MQGTTKWLAAQRHLAENMAGYSLVYYFLQTKHQHNGNIIMHSDLNCMDVRGTAECLEAPRHLADSMAGYSPCVRYFLQIKDRQQWQHHHTR